MYKLTKAQMAALERAVAGEMTDPNKLAVVTFETTRLVSTTECQWLDEDVKAGTKVFKYNGFTYGVIGPRGIAVSRQPNEGPFFELPRAALRSNAHD